MKPHTAPGQLGQIGLSAAVQPAASEAAPQLGRPAAPASPIAPIAPTAPTATGQYRIGIDIGSTVAKAAVLDATGELIHTLSLPTGYSSVDAAERLAAALAADGFAVGELPVLATGYGRISVPWASAVATEITCHGRGAAWLFGPDGVVLDIGGQDTKVICLAAGKVRRFLMNDKCSAGTGRFLDIMADRLGLSPDGLAELAATGRPAAISSMCTVFAESEVISLIGQGTPRADIACGLVESVVTKVASLAAQMPGDVYYLTGGLCENSYMLQRLSVQLGTEVQSVPLARYAGAIGAALLIDTGQITDNAELGADQLVAGQKAHQRSNAEKAGGSW
ncbi:MAG: acyl-CoA dehydratase activase [Coriobacteriales bacterium]|jgi:predicted CoA-substrate-specific enzyme activase|nr:acyl-CoA dehydratase activase [Coriobacteriales bacterium]